jgi:SAM-dependent methyltransferase
VTVTETLTEKPYLTDLTEFEQFAATLPDTRMLAVAKVTACMVMNMRWERIMVDREFPEHPWPHAQELVRDAHRTLRTWSEAAFVEGESAPLGSVSDAMEERHHDLFQTLWVNFSEADYEDRIARYTCRLEVNDLADGFLSGMRVADFGCGHGNFLHACLRAGATSGTGIDYGEESIRYSQSARDRLGVPAEVLDFRVGSVYESGLDTDGYDLAIQNGVFHHLDDEDAAYREVHRILKPGGWFWIYTDGSGAVSHDLWDASVRILKQIPYDAVLEVLDFLGVETNKRYHLGDGLNAVYRHTGYDEFVARLEGYGFGTPRRLTGGFPTDFDGDAIEADPFGVEKFGSGDIRLLVQKLA